MGKDGETAVIGARRLSSAWTLWHSRVLPGVFISVFVLATIVLFVAPPTQARWMRWLLLGVTVVGSVLVYFLGIRLKRVWLDGDSLVVVGFRRSIRIPLCDVEEVKGSVCVNPELVYVALRHPTEFGARVVFMPPWRVLRMSAHPLVRELQSLVLDASSGRRTRR